MRWKQATGLIVTAGVLCGCTTLDESLSGRYGPSPVLVAEAVQISVARQAAVVRAVGGTLLAEPVTRRDWYSLILSGFNTIDDACMTYIDDLWILERRKTRTSTILAVTGAAGAALIGAAAPTPSTAAALVILAQAFGLATAINNAVADSYLYSQNAATIKKLIRKTTAGYRQDFADKTLATSDEVVYPVASPGAAYHHMREYLALCLPPTIQAQIEVLVGGAIAVPDDLLDRVNGRRTIINPPANSSDAPAAIRGLAPRSRRMISPTTSIDVR
jgi:hypothetical protein